MHPNQYRLVLNGNGHELITYDPNQGTSTQVRFYAKNAPQLRITRYYDDAEEPETENKDRLFWIVETPDGTHYRLGVTADAQEWQRVFPNAYLEEESDDQWVTIPTVR